MPDDRRYQQVEAEDADDRRQTTHPGSGSGRNFTDVDTTRLCSRR